MRTGQLEILASKILGIEQRTVHVSLRKLKESGLITTGSQGQKPELTPLDIARLVICFLVTDKPTYHPDAARDFGALKLSPMGPFFDPPEPARLSRELTFDAVLADLLPQLTRPADPDARAYIAGHLATGLPVSVNTSVTVSPSDLTAIISDDGVRYVFSPGPAPITRDKEGAWTSETPLSRRWSSAIEVMRTLSGTPLARMAELAAVAAEEAAR